LCRPLAGLRGTEGTFPKPGEALHQSYWQTVRRGTDGAMVAAAMGRSEDRLVKRNGSG